MNWSGCKNILIIRLDNMGDLIMSSPAIRALKETYGCRITVLTSPLAIEAARLIPEIDETIETPVAWVKNLRPASPDELFNLALYLKSRCFDAAVIFNVYSQNPLPSAILAWMAGIPKRLGYCRENPYDLLNFWVPDKEPYSCILHQVERDLALVKHIGVVTENTLIKLNIPSEAITSAQQKLNEIITPGSDYILLHAGVSELKRAYPTEKWIELAKLLVDEFGLTLLFTGAKSEKPLTDLLQKETGNSSRSTAGLFDVSELAAVIARSKLLISVNTGLNVPVIVLYARTNPQHTPWKTSSRVFEFSVNSKMQSRNEVIKFVNLIYYKNVLPYPDASQIIPSVHALLSQSPVQQSSQE
jgi:ADP-heptose:LPS heptosyltransferase